MTDMGRRSGVGDMLKSVYDTNNDGIVDAVEPHAADHENGGSDEIDATGLTGIPVGAILGDASEGRKLRNVQFQVDDGAAASTIKVWIGGMWNASSVGWTADIAKGATVGDWSLSASGAALTWTPSATYGNLYAVDLYNYRNQSNQDQFASGYISGTSILFYLIKPTASSTYDWTTHVDTGKITFFAFIVTQN